MLWHNGFLSSLCAYLTHLNLSQLSARITKSRFHTRREISASVHRQHKIYQFYQALDKKIPLSCFNSSEILVKKHWMWAKRTVKLTAGLSTIGSDIRYARSSAQLVYTVFDGLDTCSTFSCSFCKARGADAVVRPFPSAGIWRRCVGCRHRVVIPVFIVKAQEVRMVII